MTKNTELTTVKAGELQVAGLGADLALMDELIQTTAYLKRIQLYSKGKAIDTGKIGPGNYGIHGTEDIKCLGDEIDIFPLCMRSKAIDSSDRDAIVITYDAKSAEFQRIKETSDVQDSGCQWGFAFLVYERSTDEFYEFFCGTTSARFEVANIAAFLPKTPAQVEALTKELGHAPQAAGPCTLKRRYLENKAKDWGWFVPVTHPCSTPFKGFDPVKANEQIAKFEAMEGSKVEKAPDDESQRAR